MYLIILLRVVCLEPSKGIEGTHNENEVRGDEKEPTILGQPSDMEEIKQVEVTQDDEDLIQFDPFEGMCIYQVIIHQSRRIVSYDNVH